MNRICTTTWWVFIVLTAILAVAGSRSQTRPAQPAKDPPDAARSGMMSVTDFLPRGYSTDGSVSYQADIQKAIDTYHQNEIRFVRDFKGKQIAFTWNFKRANTFGDHVSVDFGGGDSEVTCRHIDQKTQELMVEWNRGQWASVEGTIDDAGYETLYLKNCVINVAEKR